MTSVNFVQQNRKLSNSNQLGTFFSDRKSKYSWSSISGLNKSSQSFSINPKKGKMRKKVGLKNGSCSLTVINIELNLQIFFFFVQTLLNQGRSLQHSGRAHASRSHSHRFDSCKILRGVLTEPNEIQSLQSKTSPLY